MKRPFVFILSLLALYGNFSFAADPMPPLKIGIAGLVHGHAGNFFRAGPLTPAGGIMSRPDVELVGVVEPDRKLYDSYANHHHFPANFHYASIAEMVAAKHPQAVLIFTEPTAHRKIVEECARLGVHVMMEKPLATKYDDALAMQRAADQRKIHVLVDFETTWYASNTQAFNLITSGALGAPVKVIFRDGHAGPVKINVAPEFLSWLVDPQRGGDGALVDFGCYGPSLMTWIMKGEVPQSITAVTKHMQPDLYPNVDDEAEIILSYPSTVAIAQASWNWPFAIKQMDVYGRTGTAKVIDSKTIEIRQKREDPDNIISKPPTLRPPYDDPLHYLEAVLSGQILEGDDPSSLKTNVTVTEILDAAWQSSQTGKTVILPLPH